jgi:hypothetical protein
MLVLGNVKENQNSLTSRTTPVLLLSKCVTLRFFFFSPPHPNLVIYLFPTPPMKLKLGLQIGQRLPNRNPHGPINVPSQSNSKC